MAGVNFAGKWKPIRSEKKEEFLTAMGISPDKVKYLAGIKQTLDITHTGDDICSKVLNEDGSLIMENAFKVGVPFTPKVPEGVAEQSQYDTSWEEGGKVLRFTSKVDEKTMKVENEELVYTQTFGGVTSVEYCKKI